MYNYWFQIEEKEEEEYEIKERKMILKKLYRLIWFWYLVLVRLLGKVYNDLENCMKQLRNDVDGSGQNDCWLTVGNGDGDDDEEIVR